LPVVVLRPERRRRMQNHVAAPMTSAAATTTPTAMPALAPVESPRDCGTTEMPEPVGAGPALEDVGALVQMACEFETAQV
jgi:hypothetical protein